LYLVAKNPAFAIFAGTPFGPATRDHYAWLREGGGLALHDELYARFNLKAVPCVMIGPNGFGWFRKAVQTPGDLKGLKMRFLGLGARVMSRLGVAVIQLPGGVIYNALDTNLIDAAALLQPYIDVKMRLDRVVEHYYYPSFHRPFTAFEVMFNLDRWRSLSTEQQRLIEEVCHENVVIGIAEDERLTLEALDEIRSRGVTVHELPPAIWAAARQAWAAVADEESRKSADFRRIYRDYKRYLSTGPGGNI
jgi:TRAP-type mannitol/chloroaromatic compound transport system substrate-binding protein